MAPLGRAPRPSAGALAVREARRTPSISFRELVEQVLRGPSKETGLSLDARHWSVFTLTNGEVVRWRFYRTRDEALEVARLAGSLTPD